MAETILLTSTVDLLTGQWMMTMRLIGLMALVVTSLIQNLLKKMMNSSVPFKYLARTESGSVARCRCQA